MDMGGYFGSGGGRWEQILDPTGNAIYVGPWIPPKWPTKCVAAILDQGNG
jgi:hypothetical protein